MATTQQSNSQHLLQQYILCLQKQNQTKNVERQTLYTELNRLQQQLSFVESQLMAAKQRADSNGENELKSKIRDLEEEVMILKYEQQHLFEENLSLISTMEEKQNKIQQVERENRDLKCQKQELQRFRVTLEKISRSLEELQAERATLANANIQLAKENRSLRNLVEYSSLDLQNFQCRFPTISPSQSLINLQPTSISNYLMTSSFEKISEYEEEYEESNQNDQSNKDSRKRINHSNSNGSMNHSLDNFSSSKSLECEEESSDQNNSRSFRVRHYDEKHNESSYLMMEDRSLGGESLMNKSHSIEDGKRSFRQGLSLNQNASNVSGDISHNRDDESSCDVIQQLNNQQSQPATSHYLPPPNSSSAYSSSSCYQQSNQDQHSTIKHQQCGTHRSLQQQISTLQQKLIKSESEKQFLQQKMYQMEKTQQENVTEMEEKIEEMIKNYDTIVKYVEKLEKENNMLNEKVEHLEEWKCQAEEYMNQQHERITQLEAYHCQEHNMDQKDDSSHSQQNFQCLSSTQLNHQYQANANNQLIKQNNQLIEQITVLERQKNSLYQQCQQVSQYKQFSSKGNRPNHEKIQPLSSASRQLFQRQEEVENDGENFQNDKENYISGLNSLNHDKKYETQKSEKLFIRSNYIKETQESAHNANRPQNQQRNSLSFTRRSNRQEGQQNHQNKRRNSLIARSRDIMSPIYSSLYANPKKSQSTLNVGETNAVKQRLEKRIQTIKQQNLQLLKELQFY